MTAIPRRTLALAAFAAAIPGAQAAAWHNIDVTGASPPLAIAMTRVNDGRSVTEADYRGRVVLLYFGYTFCPDVCPTTLANLTHVLDRLGPLARHVRVLFVTVDPLRDTRQALKDYVAAFAPEVEGLRGSDDALASLARRYRVAWSVTPANRDHPAEVIHSAAIYVFDRTGAARLLIPSMASSTPDIAGTSADLRRLILSRPDPGVLSRVVSFLEQLV